MPRAEPPACAAVVFDFDGTLVDSNAIKRAGFDAVFADCPECQAGIEEILRREALRSRREIIQGLVDRMQPLPPDGAAAETARREASYARWVEPRIAERMAATPAAGFLARLGERLPLYICSLTPGDSLRRLLAGAGWLRHLTGVEGYPVRKEEFLRKVADRHGGDTSRILMVGDGPHDEAAALAVGAAFIRIVVPGDLAPVEARLCT